MPMTRDEKLAKIREVGERIRALRAKQAPDSPYAGVAFEIACMVGDVEREILTELPSESEARK